MTQKAAGALGLAILLSASLFIWWWFGTTTIAWIVGIAVVAMVLLGLVGRNSK